MGHVMFEEMGGYSGVRQEYQIEANIKCLVMWAKSGHNCYVIGHEIQLEWASSFASPLLQSDIKEKIKHQLCSQDSV